MDWTDLFTGIALVLVFEGLMPFAHPRGWRAALENVRNMSDGALRTLGLASMVAGVLLLTLVR